MLRLHRFQFQFGWSTLGQWTAIDSPDSKNDIIINTYRSLQDIVMEVCTWQRFRFMYRRTFYGRIL